MLSHNQFIADIANETQAFFLQMGVWLKSDASGLQMVY